MSMNEEDSRFLVDEPEEIDASIPIHHSADRTFPDEPIRRGSLVPGRDEDARQGGHPSSTGNRPGQGLPSALRAPDRPRRQGTGDSIQRVRFSQNRRNSEQMREFSIAARQHSVEGLRDEPYHPHVLRELRTRLEPLKVLEREAVRTGNGHNARLFAGLFRDVVELIESNSVPELVNRSTRPSEPTMRVSSAAVGDDAQYWPDHMDPDPGPRRSSLIGERYHASTRSRGGRGRSSVHRPQRTFSDNSLFTENDGSNTDDPATPLISFELPEKYRSPDSAGTALNPEPLAAEVLPGKSDVPNLRRMRIVRSRWWAEKAADSDVHVKLDVSEDAAAHPEMHWYHLCQATIGFDHFIKLVQTLPLRTEANRREITAFLTGIQTKHEIDGRLDGRNELDVICKLLDITSSGREDEPLQCTFLSMPYLHEGELETDQPGRKANLSHRSRPLLQAMYHRASLERESQQVLRRALDGATSKVLHVSQSWLLLIGDDMLLTYSRMPHTSLLPPTAKIQTANMPPPANEINRPFSHVLVADGHGRRWRLPVSCCKTWPSFSALFTTSFAEAEIAFFNGPTQVRGNDWPAIIDEVRISPLLLRIKPLGLSDLRNERKLDKCRKSISNEIDGICNAFHLPSFEDQNARGAATGSREPHDPNQSKPSPSPSPSTKTGSQARFDPFDPDFYTEPDQSPRRSPRSSPRSLRQPLLHIFSHMRTSRGPANPLTVAQDAHDVLKNADERRLRVAFGACEHASVTDLDAWLARLATDGDKKGVRKLVDLAIQAKYLFSFFWRWDAEHSMLSKFWFALISILTSMRGNLMRLSADDSAAHDNQEVTVLDTLLGCLQKTNDTAIALTRMYSDCSDELPVALEEFFQAWLHFAAGIFTLSQCNRATAEFEDSWRLPSSHFNLMAMHLEGGDRVLVEKARCCEPEKHACCTALDIAALMLRRLTSDYLAGRSDVLDLYDQYLSSLDLPMTDHPLRRGHLSKLNYFNDEIAAISNRILDTQSMMVNEFSNRVSSIAFPEDYQTEGLTDTAAGLVSQQCLTRARNRNETSKDLSQRAADLQAAIEAAVTGRKDQHEAAIYIFTVVTVIFLPLSFVSGIFGMNTSDIRNSNTSQWAYWAAAIPLTVVVIIGSMWWSGQLDPVLDWLSRGKYQWRSDGYTPLLNGPAAIHAQQAGQRGEMYHRTPGYQHVPQPPPAPNGTYSPYGSNSVGYYDLSEQIDPFSPYAPVPPGYTSLSPSAGQQAQRIRSSSRRTYNDHQSPGTRLYSDHQNQERRGLHTV